MDVVITYVDGLDPLWQQDYARSAGKPVLAKRFRDWGTLPYLMRGIERYMPFVENVFLVVSRESQVPQWVDREHLHVVLHHDIIPAGLLPVFNASAIEMFIHRIPGLSEEFIYMNDDLFPVAPCSPEDFFRGGRPVLHMKRQFLVLGNDFRYLVKHSSDFARRAAGLKPSMAYLRPQHVSTPMLKSLCDKLFDAHEKEICDSVTPLRERPNYNQYLYSTYAHYCGMSEEGKLSNRHFSLAVASIDEICAFLRNPDRKFACINDVQMSEEKYCNYRKALLEAFDSALPTKSRFEL